KPQVPAQVAVERGRHKFELLELEKTRDDIANRQALLEQGLQSVIQQREEFARERKESQKKDPVAQAANDSGFQRELELVCKLPAKQSKEHVISTWQHSPA